MGSGQAGEIPARRPCGSSTNLGGQRRISRQADRSATGAPSSNVGPPLAHSGPRAQSIPGRPNITDPFQLVSKARADPAELRELFGLTHMEAEIASVISTGAPPEQAAAETGIAVVTARNHLKAVFAKTGTHRQSERVALLSRL